MISLASRTAGLDLPEVVISTFLFVYRLNKGDFVSFGQS